MPNAHFSIQITFDQKRFEAELYKRMALSSATEINQVYEQMIEEVGNYITVGNQDVLDAEIIGV